MASEILIGEDTRELILSKIVLSTPIIKKVFAVPSKQDHTVGIYVVSDCGGWDTVVPKLIRRHGKSIAALHEEETSNPRQLKWFHPKDQKNDQAPLGAQVLYLRKDPLPSFPV